MPLRELAINQMATSHLPIAIGLSSKIVPSLTENCFLQARHCHVRRVEIKETSDALQTGQDTLPSGQRIKTAKLWALSRLEKYSTASIGSSAGYSVRSSCPSA